jgi:hypothetical protein
MGLISNLLGDLASEAAVDYAHHKFSGGSDSAIVADQHYVRIWLRSARIVNVREWSSRFHAVVHARFRFIDQVAGLRDALVTVAPATQFQDLDPDNLDRLIVVNRPLLGPIPYRGQLGMEVGLFSVKAADLAKPYIDMLLDISETAGVSLLASLKPFTEPLRRGAEALFSNKDYTELEIGLDQTDTTLTAGDIVIARVAKDAVDLTGYRIDHNDWRLLDPDGKPVGNFPYLILGVEKVSRRDDYAMIPELRDAWETLRTMAQQGRAPAEIAQQFAGLKRVIWLSPDLLDGDRKRIVDSFRASLVQAGFDAVETLTTDIAAETLATSAAAPGAPLPRLAEVLGGMPTPAPERISLAELNWRLSDPRIPIESLKPYLTGDRAVSKPFEPGLVPNPVLVDVPLDLTEEEGAAAVSGLNSAMRLRRHTAFQAAQFFGDDRPVLVSEGDSWFQFPVFIEDVIDQLDASYAIWSLDAAGDTLKMIAHEAEYLIALRRFRSSVKAFLLSAGGNDVIGEDEFVIDGRLVKKPVITQIVLPFAPERPAKAYLDNERYHDRLRFVENTIGTLFERVSSEFPDLPIICHGYDWAIPARVDDPRGDQLWCKVDEWLGGPFRRDLQIQDSGLQREIIRLMIDDLNAAMKRLCGANNSGGRFRNAWHVDVRGVVGSQWKDEVHPTNAGYRLVAQSFRDVITAALK